MGSADNAVNGVPACADSWLLQTIARDTWNFSGYMTSDCDADSDVFVSHNYTKTAEEAVAKILHGVHRLRGYIFVSIWTCLTEI